MWAGVDALEWVHRDVGALYRQLLGNGWSGSRGQAAGGANGGRDGQQAGGGRGVSITWTDGRQRQRPVPCPQARRAGWSRA